ncbi:MAG: ABC transporter ATP-binding protein [Kiritimatiellia bacterium]
MIRVKNLTKRFGRTTALDNISFEVRRGEILGILGPNGAGKTTLMRVLCSYLPPTGGTVRIDGLDVFRDSMEVRRRLGYLPERVPIYREMKVAEYLRYRGRIKGLRGKRLLKRVDEVIRTCGLEAVSSRLVGRISKGYVRRVGLADSFVHEPQVLLLDEPAAGLDPVQVRRMRSLIKEFALRHTVVLSTHMLAEVEEVCARALIMDRGRIAASDTPENLRGLFKGNAFVIVEAEGPEERIEESLRSIGGVKEVTSEQKGQWYRYSCECEGERDLRPEVWSAIASNGWKIRELTRKEGRLEDVFISLMEDG